MITSDATARGDYAVLWLLRGMAALVWLAVAFVFAAFMTGVLFA